MSHLTKLNKADLASIVEGFDNEESSTSSTMLNYAVNIRETGHKYELQVSAPGFKKSDFNVTTDGGLMTINAQNGNEMENESNIYLRREFSRPSFCRAFKLPENVLVDHVSASYDNGVLTIDLKKNDRFLVGKKHIAVV